MSQKQDKAIRREARRRLGRTLLASRRDFDAFVTEATTMHWRDRLTLAWGILTRSLARP